MNEDLSCGLDLAAVLTRESDGTTWQFWQRLIQVVPSTPRRLRAELLHAVAATQLAISSLDEAADSLVVRALARVRDHTEATDNEDDVGSMASNASTLAALCLCSWAREGLAPVSPPLLVRLLHNMLFSKGEWASLILYVTMEDSTVAEFPCLIGMFRWASFEWQTTDAPWAEYHGHMVAYLDRMHWDGSVELQPPAAIDVLTWPLFPRGAMDRSPHHWSNMVGFGVGEPPSKLQPIRDTATTPITPPVTFTTGHQFICVSRTAPNGCTAHTCVAIGARLGRDGAI